MSDTSVRRATVTLNLQEGLHLRPLTQLARVAQGFASSVALRRGEQVADAKRPLDLMSLAAGCGEQLVVEADGDDSSAAVAAIVRLFETNFSDDA